MDEIAELYRRHAPALHRRCASIVGNAEEARDLVQETFARYISAKSSWTDRASPFTVLYRIATNASIDRLRRRKTATEEELDPETRAADLGSEPLRGAREEARGSPGIHTGRAKGERWLTVSSPISSSNATSPATFRRCGPSSSRRASPIASASRSCVPSTKRSCAASTSTTRPSASS